MHFINNVYLISTLCRRVFYFFHYISDIINTIVTSSINFNNI